MTVGKLRKTNLRFFVKLVFGIAVLAIVGLVTVTVTVNTIISGTIYDNVIEIARRDQVIYAGEIDTWLTVAGQTVNSLVSTLRALPSAEHFPDIAARFTADFDFVENVFIGFADGSVFNGVGWTPSNVGRELDGIGWGPWEYWVITDRPWFLAAHAAGDGVMVTTPPYLSLTTGNITSAIAIWVPDLRGVGAVVGFSISLDFVVDRLGEHPVMGGYLMLLGADGTILFHPNPDYAPSPDGRMHHLCSTPNGKFLFDRIAEGIYFDDFYDAVLGPSYFMATHLQAVDWKLLAIIPAEATMLHVYENLSGVVAAFIVIIIGLLAFALVFVVFLTRSMEEKRFVEEKLRVIIDNMPMVSSISGSDSRLIECNGEAPKLFGLSSKQEYFERFSELEPHAQPDGRLSREKASAMKAMAIETGRNRFEWMYRHINGEPIPCEVSLVSVKWQGENLLLSFVRDLRESYATRKRERMVTQRMQAMLDSSPLACVIVEENAEVLEVNQELLRLFELADKNEYSGRFFDFSPRHQPDGRLSIMKWKEKAQQAFESGKAHFEWMHQTLSGKTIPCEVTVVCITHDEKKLLIGYIRDLREINEAVSMVKQFEDLAFTDALTGARNRRYFIETAEQELQLCVADDQDFAIILFDIDNFKSVNDTHGHDIGDEVLKIVVARTCHSLKQDTLVARYGGEEFTVMLTGVSHENAVKIAWHIQKRIEESPFLAKGIAIGITVSLGVASKTPGCTTLPEIIKNADIALYRAKETGRNKAVSYEAIIHPSMAE